MWFCYCFSAQNKHSPLSPTDNSAASAVKWEAGSLGSPSVSDLYYTLHFPKTKQNQASKQRKPKTTPQTNKTK